jgi:hypothetical protein
MKTLEDAKHLILRMTGEKNIPFSEVSWNANYKMDWDGGFAKDLKKALHDLEQLEIGLNTGDQVLSAVAVTMARISFLELSDFFFSIHEDFEKILLSEEAEWPVIPDDYIYPVPAD